MSDFDEVRCLDVSLAAKLQDYAVRLGRRAPDVAAAYASLVRRLEQAGAGAGAPTAGAAMPGFALPDSSGRVLNLADLLQSGPLVVSFNRGHWCAFCRLELLALQDLLPDLRCRGAGLVSIMPELQGRTHRLRTDFSLDFPVLTDLDNGYALALNLMVSLGSEITALFRGMGTDLADFQGNATWFVPIPATFVVDRDSSILAAHVDADFRRRMGGAAILAALDGMR